MTTEPKKTFWDELWADINTAFSPKKPATSPPDWNTVGKGIDLSGLDASDLGSLSEFLGPEGQQDISGDGLDASEPAYQISAEKLIAIQKFNSKGFQFFDINPRLLDAANYPCVVNPGDLFDLEGNPGGSGPDQRNFRTIVLPANGNFLRFEVKKARARDYGNSSPFATAYATAPSIAGNVYIQFGDNSQRPFKCRHGDTWKQFFETVLVTFPAGHPGFRIISGTGTEFQSSDSQAQTLHLGNWPALNELGGGQGFQPFTYNNFNAQFTLASGIQKDKAWFGYFGSQNLSVGEGTVLWVTGYSISILSVAASKGPVLIGLGVGNSGNTVWSGMEQVNNGAGDYTVVKREFQTPVRLTLSDRAQVANYSLYNGSSTGITVIIELNGYSVGQSFQSGPNDFVQPQFVLDHIPSYQS